MYFYGRTFASSHPARWGITRDVFGRRTPRHWPRAMQDDLHNMLSVQNPNGKHLFQKYWAATKLCRMNHFDTPYLISIYSWCSFLRLVDVSILSNPENKVGTGTGHVPWSQFCILALACSPACGTIFVKMNLDICIVKCTITRMGSHMPCIRIFGQNTSGHWKVLLLDKMSQSIGRPREAYRNWETKGQPLGLDWFGQAIPFQFEVWSIPLSKMIAIAEEFVPKDLAFATSYWLGKKSCPSASCGRAPHLVNALQTFFAGTPRWTLQQMHSMRPWPFPLSAVLCQLVTSIHLHILSANVSMQLVFQTHCTRGCWTCRSLLPRWYATCHLYTKIGQFPG